jgi:hypothetical protein
VAHLILPRAGTFIYPHPLNDLEQLTSGLFGAIVVLESGNHSIPRPITSTWRVGTAADPPDAVVVAIRQRGP